MNIVVQAFNLNSEAQKGGSLWVQSYPNLQGKSQKARVTKWGLVPKKVILNPEYTVLID